MRLFCAFLAGSDVHGWLSILVGTRAEKWKTKNEELEGLSLHAVGSVSSDTYLICLSCCFLIWEMRQ